MSITILKFREEGGFQISPIPNMRNSEGYKSLCTILNKINESKQ